MAIRPVFVAGERKDFCEKNFVEFEYFNGFSKAQKQRCVNSLHKSFLEEEPNKKVLEISSASEEELGVQLSAFNLKYLMKSGKLVSVESAFQASKVFQYGGPYTDLLEKTSREAKKDERLKNSGSLIKFELEGEEYPLNPNTFFYNWIYINALHKCKNLTEQLMEYDAFTDIAFNPGKSLNCQAEAAAIYVSLRRRNLLEEALKSKENFVDIVYSLLVNKIEKKDRLLVRDRVVPVATKTNQNNVFYKTKFKKGSEVIHPKFGKGIIVDIKEKETSATLTIQFLKEKKILDEAWILKNCRQK